MRGVVYVDILVFVNAVIGYFLLRAAARLTGRAANWRVLPGAAAAGLSSLLLLAPPLPGWLMWGARLGSGVLIVFLSFPVHNVRDFLRCCFWYLLLNLTFSGVVLAAAWYGAKGVLTNNLSVYFNVSPLLLIVCITGMYLLVRVCACAFGGAAHRQTAPFTARFAQGAVHGLALVDTGFCVRDPITGAPAFLLSFPAVRDTLPPELLHALTLYFESGAIEAGGVPLRLIPAKTAAGTRALPAVRAAELTLNTDGAPLRRTQMCAVFTPETLADGAFSAIVPADGL